MSLENNIPSVSYLMESPLDRFINLVANYCGYEGTTKELVVNQVNPLFLMDHAEASKQNNPNWNQEMNGPFVNYYWQDTCIEPETLEDVEALDVVYCEDDMNVIISTWFFKLK